SQEHDFIQTLETSINCGNGNRYWYGNIGLRCVGLECKWDDGSPVTYMNFDGKDDPADVERTRCWAEPVRWAWQDCAGSYAGHCWVCSVKAKTIECEAEETEYKEGCVSVHTSPLDQKSAEASCPGGGHLASIHGYNANGFYTQLAINAEVTGTLYIQYRQ
ncbi:hypothetical protein PENTCL1PPCAC_29936, partial [Pristionchus entomophagus]